MSTRGKKAWLRSKSKILNGLNGDVWSSVHHKESRKKGSSSSGKKEAEIPDDPDEDSLIARYVIIWGWYVVYVSFSVVEHVWFSGEN